MQFYFSGIYKQLLWSFRGVILDKLWCNLFRIGTWASFPTPSTGQYVCKQLTHWKPLKKIYKLQWFLFFFCKKSTHHYELQILHLSLSLLFKNFFLFKKRGPCFFPRYVDSSTQIPDGTVNICSLRHARSCSHQLLLVADASGLSLGDKSLGYKSITLSHTHEAQVRRNKF